MHLFFLCLCLLNPCANKPLVDAPCLACLAFFASVVQEMCNHGSSVQLHELPTARKPLW